MENTHSLISVAVSDIIFLHKFCRIFPVILVFPDIRRPHSHSLPPAYWETLLAPWAMNAAKQIVERWWRVKALIRTWGETPLHVPLLPETCTFFFATGPDFVLHGSLGHTFNHWLFSRLLEPVFPAAWSKAWLPPQTKSYGSLARPAGSARLRELARAGVCCWSNLYNP